MGYYAATDMSVGEWDKQPASVVGDALALIHHARRVNEAADGAWRIHNFIVGIESEARELIREARFGGDDHARWVIGEIVKARRVLRRALPH